MPMTQECGSLTFFEKTAEWKNVTAAIESPTLSSSSCISSQVSDVSGDEVVSQEFILVDILPCSNSNRYLPIAGHGENTFTAKTTSTLESVACLEVLYPHFIESRKPVYLKCIWHMTLK